LEQTRSLINVVVFIFVGGAPAAVNLSQLLLLLGIIILASGPGHLAFQQLVLQ